jgi:hypothetical protein
MRRRRRIIPYVEEPLTNQRQFVCKLDREGAPKGEAVGLVKIAL